MRIRSIKPEFWRSEDITALDWQTRLLFIGLWSYVDDNGVGRDNEKFVAADLFALEDDPRETLATVSRGLQALCDAGLIVRYSVDSVRLLHIVNWSKHQRIDKPNKPRYPLPTCDDAVPSEPPAGVSRDSRESPAPGAGEQGNRGTEEQTTTPCASADAERGAAPAGSPSIESDFAAWYAEYPRKRSRGAAVKAYRAARKKVDANTILDGLRSQLAEFNTRPVDKIPYPATWLNGEAWADSPSSDAHVATVLPHASELVDPPDDLDDDELGDWYRRHGRGA